MSFVYSSGSATDVADLMNKFEAFAIAQGWVEDSFIVESTGKRLHVHKGNAFFHFRSFVNETYTSQSATYGIYCNGSTSYSGAAAWDDQPGGPKYISGSTVKPAAGIIRLTSAIVSYHFFSGDVEQAAGTITGATNASPISVTQTAHGYSTGDRVRIASVGGNTAANGDKTITVTGANTYTLDGSTGNGTYTSGGTAKRIAEVLYMVVEGSAGVYQHLMVGTLDKVGTFPGGQFVTGTVVQGQSNSTLPSMIHFFGPGILFGSSRSNVAPGMVRADVDSLNGWKLSWSINTTTLNTQPPCMDSIVKMRSIINCAPNSFNSLTVLLPIYVFVFANGTANIVTTPFRPLGALPGLTYTNIRNLSPGSQHTISTDQYRVYPLVEKSDVAYSVFDSKTQHLGFSIKSN